MQISSVIHFCFRFRDTYHPDFPSLLFRLLPASWLIDNFKSPSLCSMCSPMPISFGCSCASACSCAVKFSYAFVDANENADEIPCTGTDKLQYLRCNAHVVCAYHPLQHVHHR